MNVGQTPSSRRRGKARRQLVGDQSWSRVRSAWQTGRLPQRKNKKRDRQFGPFGFGVRGCLFNVDGLAVGIKASLDANFLAFVLFQRFLMINIVGLAAGVLKNVLVA